MCLFACRLLCNVMFRAFVTIALACRAPGGGGPAEPHARRAGVPAALAVPARLQCLRACGALRAPSACVPAVPCAPARVRCQMRPCPASIVPLRQCCARTAQCASTAPAASCQPCQLGAPCASARLGALRYASSSSSWTSSTRRQAPLFVATRDFMCRAARAA